MQDSGIIIEGIEVGPRKIIHMIEGDVLHGLKTTDSGFNGFGEAYFSTVNPGAIKGWKRHKQMTMNLLVPVGTIRFVIFDDRATSVTKNQIMSVTLSRKNYNCLTVPPMVWIGFQCAGSDQAMLLNLADIPHVPDEVDKKQLDEIPYNWNVK